MPRPSSASPSGPTQRQVGAGRDRPQILGCAGVLLGVAALDVGGPLPHDLAEAVLAVDDRGADADQEHRVLGDELLGVGGGDEPGQPAAVVHVDPERLQLTADDVGAVARRRLEHAQRDRIDADHRRARPRREPAPASSSAWVSTTPRKPGISKYRQAMSSDSASRTASISSSPVGSVERHPLQLHPRLAVALDQRPPLGAHRRRAPARRCRPVMRAAMQIAVAAAAPQS